ncbi:MAG: hypothetical protein ACOYOL_07200 [Chthoniobacterales bacterium]
MDRTSTKALLTVFKAEATVQEYRIKAVASTCGNPDRYGDVIFPGAWSKAVLNDFVENGWLDVGHEWELGVGTPVSARMEGDNLVSECEFYRDIDDAENARKAVLQRMELGKGVCVSVGFMPDYKSGVFYFETGEQLLAYAAANGYDLARFDSPAIKKLTWCRAITKITQLYEWSICCVGANPKARAIAAKSYDFREDEVRAAEFIEHLDSVLAAVDGVTARFVKVADMREGDGRRVNPERVEQLKAIHASIGGLIARVDVTDEAKSEQSSMDASYWEREIRIREASLCALSTGAI